MQLGFAVPVPNSARFYQIFLGQIVSLFKKIFLPSITHGSCDWKHIVSLILQILDTE